MKKKGKRKNIVLKAIGILALVIYVIFSILLVMLNMIPSKYLLIYFGVFSVLYLIFLSFIFFKKIKKKIKIVSTVFLVVFSLVFGIGIKYLTETMDFFEVINKSLLQKEDYYVMTLKDSKTKKIEGLKNKNVGIYNAHNSEVALETLQNEVKVNEFEYKDIIEMFEELQSGNLDAVLINDSIKTLLNTELSNMNLELKEIYTLSIEIEKEDIVKVVDITKENFNIYVAGGDAYGSIERVTNTDVNMVITVNPNERKILLTSIPRDYYVNIPSLGTDVKDKLTHAGYYGIEGSVTAVEELLDIDINYYVKVNYSTVVGVIDAMDGIDLYSDFSFCVDDSNVCFKKGNNHLTGYRAMMFARERKSFKDGDIQRLKNQQKVLEAAINKATSSTKIITNFSEILDSVSESLSTNMDTKSINRFVKMQLNDMSGWSIESTNLVGTNAYSTQTYTFPGMNLYVMEQDKESVTEVRNKIKEYMK